MTLITRYRVGGAIRDRLLGLDVHETDWVVIGATQEEMLAQGFRSVGRDFPVFLHPETGDEYALGRRERKVGLGYRGFQVDASPEVSLEEDLLRRDLTINAIAEDSDGLLVDPFGGLKDLEGRLLRHISPAFTEDPVRVLRVARFAARFHSLGFKVATETLDLMREMAVSGELGALVPERVFLELRKTLAGPTPSVFFRVLREIGALHILFPELDALFGVPQSPQSHPEIDAAFHSLLVLDQTCQLTDDPVIRFAALTHDLGKACTDASKWPSQAGHESLGVPVLKGLCDRLRVPGDYVSLASKVMRFHGDVHRISSLESSKVMTLLEGLDAYRQPQWMEPFLTACEGDSRGRPSFEAINYPQADCLRECFTQSQNVKVQDLEPQDYQGARLGAAIRAERAHRIERVLERYRLRQAG